MYVLLIMIHATDYVINLSILIGLLKNGYNVKELDKLLDRRAGKSCVLLHVVYIL